MDYDRREAAGTADQAYRARQKQVAQALVRIDRLLKADAEDQKKKPLHWGYPGNLEYVLEKLGDIESFLSGNG